jgi:hypothetical protein
MVGDIKRKVEPSAGGGAFSRQIVHPNLKAFDVEPDRSNVVKNWFDFNSSVNGGVAWVGKQEILSAYVNREKF